MLVNELQFAIGSEINAFGTMGTLEDCNGRLRVRCNARIGAFFTECELP